MDDLISRQAAIDEIKALYKWHDIVTEDRAIDHFKRLPSAQPERKKGEWKAKEEREKQEIFICSECGGWAYSPWIGSRKSPKPNRCKYAFCPNCGAEMER